MIKVTLTKLQYSPSDKSLLPTISDFQYIERYNYYCDDKYQYFYFWLQFQYLDVTFYCYSLIWIEKYLKTRMPSTLFKNLLYAIWSFNRPIRALSRPNFQKEQNMLPWNHWYVSMFTWNLPAKLTKKYETLCSSN